MTITSFLESKGFTVLSTDDSLPSDNTLDMISLLLCFQYPFLRQWLWDIRKRNVRKNRSFSTNLTGFDKKHAAMIRNLCFMLQKNGLFEEYSFDQSTNRARGIVAGDERALGFLTGGWLERCVKVCVDGFLNLEHERFECVLNAEVHRPIGPDGIKRKFEMDILLRIDQRIYWWEVSVNKSASW